MGIEPFKLKPEDKTKLEKGRKDLHSINKEIDKMRRIGLTVTEQELKVKTLTRTIEGLLKEFS